MSSRSNSKKVAIMQPTYLPWLGYFDLIDAVDAFVLLDTVQFEKQTWQQRNQLRTHKGLEWITAPVLIKGRFGQAIKDVELNDVTFVNKHLKQITHNYQKSKGFDRYFAEFSEIFQRAASRGSLCFLNVELIKWLCSKFGISTELVMASDLNAQGKRSELIVSILKALDSSAYVSPRGSADYITNDYPIFEKNGISIFYHSYKHPEYAQAYKPFVSFACALDVLFNEGEKSKEVINSGREDLIAASEVMVR
jgi:hypothetical protein